jgi:8-oxo-dGTP pyrophosphatase MutT (NUDIX family)
VPTGHPAAPGHLDAAGRLHGSGETTEQAALREVWEESGVRAEIVSPYSIFSVPKISEVYIIFRAIALEITGQYGPETLDYKFFAPEDIPWEQIYYPAIRQILERYIEERRPGCMACTWAMTTAARFISCADQPSLARDTEPGPIPR